MSLPFIHRGRDALIYLIDDRTDRLSGRPSDQPIVGLRLHELRFNNQLIDLYSAQRGRRWRHTCGDSGLRIVTLSGNGLLLASDSDRKLVSIFLSGEAVPLRIVFPDFLNLVGTFVIEQLALTSPQDDEISWFVELQSADEIAVALVDAGLS